MPASWLCWEHTGVPRAGVCCAGTVIVRWDGLGGAGRPSPVPLLSPAGAVARDPSLLSPGHPQARASSGPAAPQHTQAAPHPARSSFHISCGAMSQTILPWPAGAPRDLRVELCPSSIPSSQQLGCPGLTATPSPVLGGPGMGCCTPAVPAQPLAGVRQRSGCY